MDNFDLPLTEGQLLTTLIDAEQTAATLVFNAKRDLALEHTWPKLMNLARGEAESITDTALRESWTLDSTNGSRLGK